MDTLTKLAAAFGLLVWLVALAYQLFRTDGLDDSRAWIRFGLSAREAVLHGAIALSLLVATYALVRAPLVPVVTIAGFACIGTAIMFHGLRTKTKYTWESVRYPMTRGERLGLLYGVIFFLGSIATV